MGSLIIMGSERAGLALILGALTALGPLSIDMYLPALPALARDLAAGPSLIQLTLTACLVGLALGQAVAGPLSDAVGRRRPLLAGGAVYAVSSALCVIAPTVQTLILLRLVQGAAGGAAIVIARAIVRDRCEGAAAARLFALLMQISGVAPILAPLIGGEILRVTSWRGVFALIAILGVALVVAVLTALPETLGRERRRPGGLGTTLRTFRQLVADRAFAGYALSSGLAFAAMFAYISGSPFVIQDVYGLSPQAFSLIFALNGAGIVAAGQVSGRLSARFPATILLASGLATSLGGALILLAAVLTGAGLPVPLAGMFLVVSGIGLTMPNGAALALSGQPPERAGTASALLGLAQFVIGGAAAPLVGAFGTHTAVPMAVVITALAAGAALAAPARRTRTHRP
ncbi:multidrug effflux MFS transporter [Streptosporangium sp. NPDC000396]|uniref:multidrug effflux MFS transporter n=1 Tax=Streptosporangium sp. NPDC000396 TaxID=3366185 RepID=UPI0036BDC571